MCADFATGASGGVALLGGDAQQPLRYAQALQLPLRLHAAFRRTKPCSDHTLVLSSKPTAPEHPGILLSILAANKYMFTDCLICPGLVSKDSIQRSHG